MGKQIKIHVYPDGHIRAEIASESVNICENGIAEGACPETVSLPYERTVFGIPGTP